METKDFDNIQSQLEKEVHNLKEENSSKDETIDQLNSQVNKLKELENYSEYKEKYESMQAEYEKEKERLTKLYQLYEETDSQCKRLKEQCNSWQNWYDSNREIFEKLFSKAPPVGTTVEEPTPEEFNIESVPKKEKKSKRKFRLKK